MEPERGDVHLRCEQVDPACDLGAKAFFTHHCGLDRNVGTPLAMSERI